MKESDKGMKKVMFISSTGGHLTELMQLKSIMKDYEYSLITEKTKANNKLKRKYKKISFLLFSSIFISCQYKSDYIITTGAHTAGPMCSIGRIFGSKIIYIESFANIKTKTITGTLFYKFHIANLFIVQWRPMLKLYPKATYGGWCF